MMRPWRICLAHVVALVVLAACGVGSDPTEATVGPAQHTTLNSPTSTLTALATTTLGLPNPSEEVDCTVSDEEIPWTFDDPQVWLDEVYAITAKVYNCGDYSLLEHIHAHGESGVTGEWVKGHAIRFQEAKLAQDIQEPLVIFGTLLEADPWQSDGTIPGDLEIVETVRNPFLVGHPLYPDGVMHRRMRLLVSPPQRLVQGPNGLEMLPAPYRIRGIFDEGVIDVDTCRELLEARADDVC